MLGPLTGGSIDGPGNVRSTSEQSALVGALAEVPCPKLGPLMTGNADRRGNAGSLTVQTAPVGNVAEDTVRKLEPLAGETGDGPGNAPSTTERTAPVGTPGENAVGNRIAELSGESTVPVATAAVPAFSPEAETLIPGWAVRVENAADRRRVRGLLRGSRWGLGRVIVATSVPAALVALVLVGKLPFYRTISNPAATGSPVSTEPNGKPLSSETATGEVKPVAGPIVTNS